MPDDDIDSMLAEQAKTVQFPRRTSKPKFTAKSLTLPGDTHTRTRAGRHPLNVVAAVSSLPTTYASRWAGSPLLRSSGNASSASRADDGERHAFPA